MRVVQAIESGGPGGAEKTLIQLSLALRRRGHEVHALLLRDGWLGQHLRDSGVPTTMLRIGSPFDRAFAGSLRERLARLGADIFHSHELTYALYGRIACRALDIPQVATVHGKNFFSGLKRRLVAGALLRGRGFAAVAVSRNLARALSHALALPDERIRVVPNGVPLADSAAATPRDPAEPLRLVAIGNLYPVKNHGLLIDGVARLRRAGLPVELDILGRGREEGALSARIERYDLGACVRLRGFREDVDRFLGRAHVFVSGSRSEGMPLSFLEAMGRRLPVVATRVGGVPEIVEHGVHGLLYPEGDVEALAGALSRLARDERFRRRLGDEAREAVRSSYSVDAMLERYLDLYAVIARG